MKIHFYKAKKGNLKDKLIGLFSVFSHVELEINGICYSSSNRDGGIRDKQIDTTDKKKWVTFDFKEYVDVNSCLAYFDSVEYQEYDWANIFLTQLIKLNIQSENKQICSEFVANCLGLENAHKYSPESLFYKLKELNYI